MHLARDRVHDRRVPGADALHHAPRLADRSNSQSLGDDCNVALRAPVLDNEPA